MNTTLQRRFGAPAPAELALSRALMVRVGAQTYAIPLGSVSQILRVEREQIERIAGESVVRIAEQIGRAHV